MNQLNPKIEQTLHRFKALPNIEPSDEWQQSVLDKLATTKRRADAPFSNKVMTFGILLFIGLNVGFIWKETAARLETESRFETSTALNTPTLNNEREAAFGVISNELFSTQTSINR